MKNFIVIAIMLIATSATFAQHRDCDTRAQRVVRSVARVVQPGKVVDRLQDVRRKTSDRVQMVRQRTQSRVQTMRRQADARQAQRSHMRDVRVQMRTSKMQSSYGCNGSSFAKQSYGCSGSMYMPSYSVVSMSMLGSPIATSSGFGSTGGGSSGGMSATSYNYMSLTPIEMDFEPLASPVDVTPSEPVLQSDVPESEPVSPIPLQDPPEDDGDSVLDLKQARLRPRFAFDMAELKFEVRKAVKEAIDDDLKQTVKEAIQEVLESTG